MPEFPLLDDLEAAVDLTAQRRVGEVVGSEGGAYGASEFFERPIRRMLRPAPREASAGEEILSDVSEYDPAALILAERRLV